MLRCMVPILLNDCCGNYAQGCGCWEKTYNLTIAFRNLMVTPFVPTVFLHITAIRLLVFCVCVLAGNPARKHLLRKCAKMHKGF